MATTTLPGRQQLCLAVSNYGWQLWLAGREQLWLAVRRQRELHGDVDPL
jgi:hypothetical protein